MNIEKAIQKQKKALKKIERRIKKAEEKKQERIINRMKEFIIEWLISLRQFGIIVMMNKEDGGGNITKIKLMKMDINKVYYKYALDTIEKVEEEIGKRKSELQN